MANNNLPTLSAHLASLLGESRNQLRESVIPTLLHSIEDIATTLRSTQQVSHVGSANTFGDAQLNLDLSTDAIIRTAIQKCPSIITASSEENPVEKAVHDVPPTQTASSGETYTLAFDPLDGSSIIPANWTVGTILGLWDGSTALHQPPAERQIAAILGVLGPRTTAFVALNVPGCPKTCFEVGLADAEPKVLRTNVSLAPVSEIKTRYFAPANLRAAAQDARYMALISRFIEQRYTLRYCGGLVPDVVHALVKGHGVYVSPTTAASPAKLRRLYELVPIALVMECAGGRAVDASTGEDVLGKEIGDVDERGGLVCGTASEVEDVVKDLGLSGKQ
ncbi:carbohydrate phosphatase [Polyplosphaeria fusca]|uniref:Carbohydrate phosphatase n=1 Tax=Polyplosphaeria fusca TaxID=682080 RepID=A0A9P4R4I9_9PLEO|nr:carbohydrate phosphatase [Polyplosphaeria fusca]